MPITVVSKLNDRLDRICYAYYRTTASRQVERVLEANPGLENYGILLPPGVTITLPDFEAVDETPKIIQVKLWQ